MPEGLQGFLTLLLVIVALAAVLWYGRRRLAGGGKDGGAKVSDRAYQERAILQKAIEKLQINLMEFSRDVEARLDTRISTLGRLIQDADERIEVLRELTGNASKQRREEPPALHSGTYRLADDGLDKVEIARRTSTTPGEVGLILGLRRTRSE